VSKQLTKAEKEADLARRRGLVEVDGKVKPRSAVAFLTTHHPDSKKGKPTGVKHVVKRKSAIKHMAEEARVCAPRSPALHCMHACVCVCVCRALLEHGALGFQPPSSVGLFPLTTPPRCCVQRKEKEDKFKGFTKSHQVPSPPKAALLAELERQRRADTPGMAI